MRSLSLRRRCPDKVSPQGQSTRGSAMTAIDILETRKSCNGREGIGVTHFQQWAKAKDGEEGRDARRGVKRG